MMFYFVSDTTFEEKKLLEKKIKTKTRDINRIVIVSRKLLYFGSRLQSSSSQKKKIISETVYYICFV